MARAFEPQRSTLASPRRRRIDNRLAKGVELIAIMLAGDRIEHGDRRRHDEDGPVSKRCGGAGRPLDEFFAKANPGFGQGLAAIDAAADELDDFWIFGECPVI